MAYSLPQTQAPDIAFGQSLKRGTDFYHQLVSNAIARAQERRAQEKLPYELKHMMGLESRANAAASRNAQARSEAHQNYLNSQNPLYGFSRYQKLKEAIEKMRAGQNSEMEGEGGRSYMPTIGQGERQEPEQQQNPYMESAPGAEHQMPSYIEGAEQNLPSFIQKAMQSGMLPQSLGAKPQEEIPQLNENMHPKAQSGSLIPGMNDDYVDQALLAKALGIPVPKMPTTGKSNAEQLQLYKDKRDYDLLHPKPSTTGISEADRAADRALKQAQLDERIQHNRALEKTASTEEKVALAKQRNDLEVAKKKMMKEDEASIAYTKTLNEKDAKTYSDMQDKAIAGIENQPDLDELAADVSNPIFEDMRKHPYLGHTELDYYKKNGTPEQQKLAANFELHSNKIIASMAKGLNTRFTNMDLAFAKEMKVSPRDSLEGARAKVESLLYLQQLGQKRLDLALEIAKDNKVKPYDAVKLADQRIEGDKVRAAARAKVYGIQSNSNPNDKMMVMVEVSPGKFQKMTRAQAKALGAE